MGHRVENKATSCLGLLENKLGVFFFMETNQRGCNWLM